MITLNHNAQLEKEDPRSALSLKRLTPSLRAKWQELGATGEVSSGFERRLAKHWSKLFTLLIDLYGDRYDFFYHLEQILLTAAQAWHHRTPQLKAIDEKRVTEPDWFQSNEMVGGALYVDLFSNNLQQLRQSIGYFKELGLTYLHLMPLFESRPGNSDGGYAISDYREINAGLGTMEDLRELAVDLHKSGIALVLDFVFNHTADNHDWALRAQAGEQEFEEYYFIYADRNEPDAYEQSLREIFPSIRRGNFSWHDGMQRWVWTTFNSFQWDLNYRNPAVFRAMADEMFFIANTGVDILRLDALAFIWKEKGTSCENRPEAHKLIQAFNCLARIATPGLVFKSEAIVHPDEVMKYIGEDECQLSYNPTLMALLWESLATTKTELLRTSLAHRHKTPHGTTWVNYLRCHDDIGWTFDDADARSLGINAFDHRRFLNEFYLGRFEGSFARGVPFQENPQTGDMRIAGTLASLAGLEQAAVSRKSEDQELALRRIGLLQGINLSIGGIPLIYLGEEWGMLNDYSFANDPGKADDSRWVHRTRMDWGLLQRDKEGGTYNSVQQTLFDETVKLIQLRKRLPALASQGIELISDGNQHILAFVKSHAGHRLVVLANFSSSPQALSGNVLRTAGLGRFFRDEIREVEYSTVEDVVLEGYQVLWLTRI